MRRRLSFVTNSSSSSFIVAWDKPIDEETKALVTKNIKFYKVDIVYNDSINQKPLKLDSENSLTKLIRLFQDQNGLMHTKEELENRKEISTLLLAISSLTKQGIISKDQSRAYFDSILEKMQQPFCQEEVIYKTIFAGTKGNVPTSEFKRLLKEERKLVNQLREKVAREFFELNKDKYVYVYIYSDNDGELYADLEHGGTFDELSSVTFDNH